MNIGILTGLIQLRDEFTGVLNRVTSNLDKVGRNLTNVGSQLTKTVTAPILAVGGYAVKAAIDFESSFAGVRKTVNATEEEFAQLSKGLRDLAAGPNAIPIDVNELNAVAEAAGQLGIAKDDILAFTRTMADLGQTTNLTADEAATATAQFQNIFGQAGKEVDRFGATLVALGNDGASTERDIISMGLRIAAAGNQIGLSQGEVMGFASALSSVGIEAEAGGSAISKVMIDIALAVATGGRELQAFAAVAGQSSAQFAKSFRDDAAGALTAFIEGLGRLEGEDTLRVLDQMQIKEVRMRNALLSAAGAGDLLRRSLNLQAKAWQDNSALTSEAAKRYQTFESQLKITWNRVKDVAITLGTSLLPVLRDVLDILQPIIAKIADWVQSFSQLPKPIRTITLGIAALVAAAGPVLVIAGQIAIAWGAVAGALPAVGAAIGSIVAVITGPVGWVAAAAALLLAWKPARTFLFDLGKSVIGSVVTAVRKAITTFREWWQSTEEVRRFLAALVKVIAQDVLAAVSAVVSRVREWAAIFAIFQTAIAVMVRRFLEWTGVLPNLRLAISSISIAVNTLLLLIKRLPGAILDAIGGLHGLVKIASFINPAFAPIAAKMEEWVTRAKAEAARAAKEIADETAKQAKKLEKATAAVKTTAPPKLPPLPAPVLPDLSVTENQIDAYNDLLKSLHAQIVGTRQIIAEYKKSERAGTLRAESLDREAQATQQASQFTGIYRDTIHDAALAVAELQARSEDARFLAQMRETVKVSVERFKVAGGTAKELLNQEIAESQLAAALNLSSLATKEMIAEAEALAKADTIAAQATRARAEAERLFAEAAKDRLQTEFEANVAQVERDSAGISIDPTGQIIAGIFDTVRKRSEEFAQGVKDSLATVADSYKEYKRKIELSVKLGHLTAEQGKEAVGRVEQARWDETLSTADRALGFLADKFGGFFAYLQSLVNTIQQGRAFGQSVQQLATAVGGANQSQAYGQAAAALGSVATILYVVYTIYTEIQDYIRKARLKKFGQTNEFSIKNSIEQLNFWDKTDLGRLDEWGRAFAKEVTGLIRSIEDTLGISITDLAKITLKFRNDGKQVKAYVEGQFIGLFTDVSDAIAAAVQVALKNPNTAISGLSELMRQGLTGKTRFQDLDELVRFLGQLREISDLGLPQGALQLRETTRRLDELWIALSRLRAVTPEVTQGFTNLIATETTAFTSWRNAITGHQESAQEALARLQAEAKVFNAEKALRILDYKLRYDQLKREADLLRVRAQLGGAGGEVGRRLLQNQYDEMKVRVAIANAGKSLVEAQLEILDAMLAAIQDAISALEAIPDIDLSEVKLPKGFGEHGGIGDPLDSIRSFIEDRRFQLATAAMGEYLARVAEITREYDKQIEQAGKDVALRGQLIDLRNQELRQLRAEQADSLVVKFRDFLKLVNPFDQIRATAAGLIKEIEGSPFGDVRKARMIGRIMADLNRQVEELARQTAAGLLGELVGDLEKFGASEKLLTEARSQMAILEHGLKMAHYAQEIAILEVQGALSADVLAALHKAFDFLQTIDPTDFLPTLSDVIQERLRERREDAAQRLADAVKSAIDKLRKYQTDGLDPLTKSLREINADFVEIEAALGRTPEVLNTKAAAIQRAIDSFLEPIKRVQRDLFFGDASVADTMTQWAQIQADFAQTQQRFRAGDLSVVSDVPDLVQELLRIAREVTPVGSEAYRSVFTSANRFLNEVLALSPETLGSANNPMVVSGMADMAAIGEAQLETLDRILAAGDRTALAVEKLNSRTVGTGTGLAAVA